MASPKLNIPLARYPKSAAFLFGDKTRTGGSVLTRRIPGALVTGIPDVVRSKLGGDIELTQHLPPFERLWDIGGVRYFPGLFGRDFTTFAASFKKNGTRDDKMNGVEAPGSNADPVLIADRKLGNKKNRELEEGLGWAGHFLKTDPKKALQTLIAVITEDGNIKMGLRADLAFSAAQLTTIADLLINILLKDPNPSETMPQDVVSLYKMVLDRLPKEDIVREWNKLNGRYVDAAGSPRPETLSALLDISRYFAERFNDSVVTKPRQEAESEKRMNAATETNRPQMPTQTDKGLLRSLAESVVRRVSFDIDGRRSTKWLPMESLPSFAVNGRTLVIFQTLGELESAIVKGSRPGGDNVTISSIKDEEGMTVQYVATVKGPNALDTDFAGDDTYDQLRTTVAVQYFFSPRKELVRIKITEDQLFTGPDHREELIPTVILDWKASDPVTDSHILK